MTDKLRHDQLFRSALDEPKVAIDFLNSNLSKEYKEIIDINTVKLEKGSFVEKALRNSITDVLFSAKLKNDNRDGYIFLLFEHLSTPQHFTAFRLLKYMVNIWSHHLAKNKKSKVLPLILSTVYYNGKQKYNVPRNLWGLFQNPSLAKKILTSDYELVDITKVPDKEIKKRKYSGLFELSMKHINDENLIDKIEEVESLLKSGKTVSIDYIESVLYYLLPKLKKDDRIRLQKLLHDALNQEGEKIMTSLAQHWKQEGIQEGIQKGELKKAIIIAKMMLTENKPIEEIIKYTGLSNAEIEKLKTNKTK